MIDHILFLTCNKLQHTSTDRSKIHAHVWPRCLRTPACCGMDAQLTLARAQSAASCEPPAPRAARAPPLLQAHRRAAPSATSAHAWERHRVPSRRSTLPGSTLLRGSACGHASSVATSTAAGCNGGRCLARLSQRRSLARATRLFRQRASPSPGQAPARLSARDRGPPRVRSRPWPECRPAPPPAPPTEALPPSTRRRNPTGSATPRRAPSTSAPRRACRPRARRPLAAAPVAPPPAPRTWRAWVSLLRHQAASGAVMFACEPGGGCRSESIL